MLAAEEEHSSVFRNEICLTIYILQLLLQYWLVLEDSAWVIRYVIFLPKFGKKYRYESERGRNEYCVCHLGPACYLHAQVYDFMIYAQTDMQKIISTLF